MKKDTQIYLNDILESIEIIQKYFQNITKEEFKNNLQIQDAVIRRLEIIGEAARSVSDDFRQSHPEVPWREVADLRNVLIHEYSGIDIKRIWKIVIQDLPILKKQIEGIL